MKSIESNTIHFQVTGDNSSPDNIPWKKLKSIVEAYINLISSFNVHLLNGEEFTLNEFFLTNINACCTDISLEVKSESPVKANDLMIKTFKNSNKNELPYAIKKNANLLNRELIDPNLALKLFDTAGVDIAYEPSFYDIGDVIIEERRTIYGKMINIGGKDPNFHLVDHTGTEFIIGGITEKDAADLANKLYRNIGVVVDCKIHTLTMEIDTRCKFIELLPYDDRNWLEESAKFISTVPSIFSSTAEMHEKLTEIRRGTTK